MRGRETIGEMLARAREGTRRVTAGEARDAAAAGALLVDIRSEHQRERDGSIPGVIWFPRNVLEWRACHTSPAHDACFGDLDRQVILICDEGYQSSLAAATLRRLGFHRATDLVGGFQAWRAAGLPTEQ